MTGRHRAPGRRWRFGLVGVVLAVAASAAAATAVSAIGVRAPEAPGPPATPALAWAIAAEAEPVVARPVRLRIPAIGVDSPLVDLGVGAAGELVPPTDPGVAGWFTGGPAPGAIGPALLAGHVDSYTGPAVFYRLVDLEPGDTVEVAKADGGTARFAVTSTKRVAKTAFPTELVYGPLPVPMLRLVTCGGTFDEQTRSYRDNIIVEAEVI